MKKDLLKFMFMLFALIAGTNVKAQTSGSCGTNATWSYEGTTLTISGSGEMSDFDIVEYVTTAPWKDYLEAIKTIEIESGVTSVGNNAFFGCTALTSVTFPSEGFTRIGDYAFSGCTSFKNLNMPSSMTTIGQGAFSNSGVKRATIYGGVQKIGDYAFESCGNLEDVAIYEGVEEIGECAFDGCAFTSVVIPSTVTTIGEGAFMLNDKLESVYIGAKVTNIGAGAFQFCTSLRSVGIGGATAPTLGDAVFTGEADALLDIDVFYVPSTTPYSGGWGGYAASKFKTLYEGTWTNSDVPEQGSGTWSFDVPTGTLTVNGTGIMDVNPWMDMTAINPMIYEEEHPGFWSNVKKLVVGEGITELRSLCVAMQINCASVTLPSTLTYVGNSCLEECAFTSITLPEGLKTIDDYTFYGSKLTTITLPSSLTYLGNSAFLDNKDLATVTCLGTTPPTCGSSENPFGDGSYLTAIYVPAEAVNAYQEANKWSTYATKIQAAVSKTDPEVTAPAAVQDLKYSGAAQTLISAGSTTGGTLQYSLDGETYSTDLPEGTDAKAYTVHYKVVGNEAYNDVAAKTITATIAAKAVAEPTITLEPSTFVYDGEAKVPTVTVKDGTTTIKAEEYSVSYKQGETAVEACKKAGTYTVVITDKEGGNYTVSGTATFTINKTDPTVTAPTAVQDLKYSGAAQTLITAGSTTGGTLQYSLDGETYSTDLPEGTDAKAYTVHYKVVGNEAYNDVAAKTITATIAAKAVAAPAITLEPSTFVYDGEAKVPTVTVMDGEATIKAEEYSVSYKQGETAVDDCKEAGTYTVVITDKEGGNYTVSGMATFTINKTDPEVTAPTAIQDLTYSGAAQTLITAGATTGGTLQYSLDGETYSTELPEGTDAKAYTVHYKVVGNEAYNDVAAKTITATIAAKAVAAPTITLEPSTFEYDGEAKEPKVTVMDGEATIKAEEYSVSYKQGETAVDECKEAGTYTVVITDKEGGNYTVSGTATFTITATEEKADPEVTAPAAIQDLTYTGAAQTLISAGATTGGTLQYSLDGGAYSTDLPKGTDAKAYTIDYKVVGNEAYNDVEAKTITATIAAKVVAEPTITLEPTYYVCDDEAKEPKVTVMDGEATIKAEEYSISYKQGETVVTACKEVGTYTVVITDKEGGNYTVNGTATFTITEKPNKEIVNEESPVLIDGEPFYELAQEVKEAIKENFNTEIAVSAEASNRMEVTEIGSIKFLKGPSVTMAIQRMKPGSTIVIYADGTFYIDGERAREFSSHFTRGGGDTSSDDFMELVSGVEYEVLTDGDLILTIALEEEEATLEGITVTEPEDEPDEPDETYPITIGKNNKTTFCGDKGLDFSGTDEVKAFIATGFDKNEGTIWLTRVKDVPAGVPVLIKGKANETYNIPVTAGGTSHYENMFVGNTSGASIKINETSEDGQYVNYYMSGGQFVSVSGNAKIGNNKCYLQLPANFEAETTGEAYQVKIADSGKSSFAAPYDLDFTDLGDDLKAFTATGYDKSTRTIWLTRVMKVQKGEGLFLKGTGGVTYTIPSAGAQAAYENMIVGNITGKTIEIGETDDDGKLTNYYLKGGTYMSVVGSANIGNNKSYLQLPTYMLAGARSEDNLDHLVMPTSLQFAELETESMPLILGNTTGIRTTDCTDDTDESTSAWYDMQGRKYDSQPTKPGLYIHKGKKVVIK